MTPSKQPSRIAGLDLLRALAIVLVLVAHYPKPEGEAFVRMLNFGWIGVDLFFVLSGYLIGGQLFAAMTSGTAMTVGNFYGRRLLRTLPNYYVVLSIYLIVSAPAPAWKFLSFTQNFGIPNAFTPSWSLCVEEQFYLAFPLVVMALAKTRSPKLVIPVFGAILVFGIGIRAAIWTASRPDQMAATDALSTYMGQLYFPTYCRLDGITLGVGLAALKTFRPGTWQRLMAYRNWLLGGSAAFLFVSVIVFWTRYTFLCSTIGFTTISLSFALLTAAVLSSPWRKAGTDETVANRQSAIGKIPSRPVDSSVCPRFLSWAVSGGSIIERYSIPATHLVAKLSYGIYLTHSLAIDCAARIVSLQSPAGIAVTATLVMVFAASLYRLVERPCLVLRDRLFSRQKSTTSFVRGSGWSRPVLGAAETARGMGR